MNSGRFCPIDGRALDFDLDEIGRVVPRCRACEVRRRAEARLAEIRRERELARSHPCEGCPARVAPRRDGRGRQARFCDACRKARMNDSSRRHQAKRYAGFTPEQKAAFIAKKEEHRRQHPEKHRANTARWMRAYRAKKRMAMEQAA